MTTITETGQRLIYLEIYIGEQPTVESVGLKLDAINILWRHNAAITLIPGVAESAQGRYEPVDILASHLLQASPPLFIPQMKLGSPWEIFLQPAFWDYVVDALSLTVGLLQLIKEFRQRGYRSHEYMHGVRTVKEVHSRRVMEMNAWTQQDPRVEHLAYKLIGDFGELEDAIKTLTAEDCVLQEVELTGSLSYRRY